MDGKRRDELGAYCDRSDDVSLQYSGRVEMEQNKHIQKNLILAYTRFSNILVLWN